jgi:hypothetical protein
MKSSPRKLTIELEEDLAEKLPPRVDFRRFADRRDLPRSSCGNTWRGTEGQLNVVRTASLYTPLKSIEICMDRGTTLSSCRPSPSIISMTWTRRRLATVKDQSRAASVCAVPKGFGG